MITCLIEYEINPYKKKEFIEYGKYWEEIIPRLGIELIGYFAPHEGSLTKAYGIYTFASLAEYEAYKQKLTTDEHAQKAFAFSRQENLITKEDRIFLKQVTNFEETPK